MAVAASNLTTAAGNAQQTSYTTASVSPASNGLLLVWVYSIAATQPNVPSISGNGLTWAQVDTQLDTSGLRRITLFRAMGASPSSGAVTISFSSQTQQGTCWSLVQYTGADTSGTNGSGAIVQSAKAASVGNAMSLTVTLSAFSSAGNATAGGFGIPLNTAGRPVTGTGFTATGQANQGSTNTAIGSEFNAGNDTTVDMNAAGSSIPWVGIAVEIKQATAGATGQIKVYNGSSFVDKPVKVWNGSAWVVKPLKRWNGSGWVTTAY